MTDATPDLDLSPRTGPDDLGPAPRRSPLRGLVVGAVIVALVVAAGALLINQVTSSSLYYYNVDEAVAQRESLGDRDIRIQGTVVGEPTEQGNDDALVFDLAFNGASVAVRHLGPEPPPLFDADVPAVLEGHFVDDGSFVSERIVIKHSEEYREENPEHVEGSPE